VAVQWAEELLPPVAAGRFSGLSMETRNRGRAFFRVEGVDDRFLKV
jgi:hypothetical protein